MLSDGDRGEINEEGNLLIEAVSLLVERQRETESWIAEQLVQAEERAAAAERLYGDLEQRLAGIEAHLARLVRDVEPLARDDGLDERLERLRQQVEALKASGEVRTLRPVLPSPQDVGDLTARDTRPGLDRPAVEPPSEPAASGPSAAHEPPAVAAAGQAASVWELLGPRPQDRFGLALIGAGLVAVLYAILTQLQF